MKNLKIFPAVNMVIRFATIMAILFSIVIATTGASVCYILLTFIISIVIVGIFAYSFRIIIKDGVLYIYQYFIKVSTIRIADIQEVYYTPFADNGQGCALVVVTNGKYSIFPVRLYGSKKVDFIVKYLNKGTPSIKKAPQKKDLHKINVFKFGLLIVVILVASKVIRML